MLSLGLICAPLLQRRDAQKSPPGTRYVHCCFRVYPRIAIQSKHSDYIYVYYIYSDFMFLWFSSRRNILMIPKWRAHLSGKGLNHKPDMVSRLCVCDAWKYVWFIHIITYIYIYTYIWYMYICIHTVIHKHILDFELPRLTHIQITYVLWHHKPSEPSNIPLLIGWKPDLYCITRMRIQEILTNLLILPQSVTMTNI